jgi:hypothetical protein
LKELGYQYFTIKEDADCILIDPYETDGMWYEHTKETLKESIKWIFDTEGYKVIDCGIDEGLFLSLAAIRTDTDKNQWFASKTKNPKYPMRVCTEDDYKEFFGLSFNNYQKMSAEEIQKFYSAVDCMDREQNNKLNEKYFIWIAREPDVEDKYSDAYIPGKLSAFYDTPIYHYNSDTKKDEWCCARKISDIPSYMFPNITFENSPVKFEQINK